MTTQLPGASADAIHDEPATRVVRIIGRDQLGPPEAWEWPATQGEMKELSTRRFERLPHRPITPAEVPPGAHEALLAVVGDVGLERLFVIPRNTRMVDVGREAWAVSPTEVLAVGEDTLAVWLDDRAGPRIRAKMRIDEVVAILDRTVLLLGRLEIVGRDESIVVRYSTVGRADLRNLLAPVRAAADPLPPPPAVGRDPRTLPHKWMALVRSSDVGGGDGAPAVVAAGTLVSARPLLHTGVAVLTTRELIVATDPTPDAEMAQYGFDLVVVPRERVLELAGSGSTLTILADAWPDRVGVRVAAHPSLVAEATGLLGPLVRRGS